VEGQILDVSMRVALPRAEFVALCRKYHVKELAVFGSALGDDFRPNSDVDFLVEFENDDAGPWMSRLTGLHEDLVKLLGRDVDVIERKAVEKSRNPFRRKAILRGMKLLYVA